jgi:hypothetical protein
MANLGSSVRGMGLIPASPPSTASPRADSDLRELQRRRGSRPRRYPSDAMALDPVARAARSSTPPDRRGAGRCPDGPRHRAECGSRAATGGRCGPARKLGFRTSGSACPAGRRVPTAPVVPAGCRGRAGRRGVGGVHLVQPVQPGQDHLRPDQRPRGVVREPIHAFQVITHRRHCGRATPTRRSRSPPVAHSIAQAHPTARPPRRSVTSHHADPDRPPPGFDESRSRPDPGTLADRDRKPRPARNASGRHEHEPPHAAALGPPRRARPGCPIQTHLGSGRYVKTPAYEVLWLRKPHSTPVDLGNTGVPAGPPNACARALARARRERLQRRPAGT